MPKKITCFHCYERLGEIATGSKIRKGTGYVCQKCQDKIKIMENMVESVNPLKDIFRGFK